MPNCILFSSETLERLREHALSDLVLREVLEMRGETEWPQELRDLPVVSWASCTPISTLLIRSISRLIKLHSPGACTETSSHHRRRFHPRRVRLSRRAPRSPPSPRQVHRQVCLDDILRVCLRPLECRAQPAEHDACRYSARRCTARARGEGRPVILASSRRSRLGAEQLVLVDRVLRRRGHDVLLVSVVGVDYCRLSVFNYRCVAVVFDVGHSFTLRMTGDDA